MNLRNKSFNKSDYNERVISLLDHLESDENRNIEKKLRSFRDWFSDEKNSNMNLYPSDKKGSCHSFCLAIANKKFDRPRKGLDSGFKGIMTELTAYWFDCLGTNQETLILTSSWDTQKFEENYKGIIDAFTKNHKKKVFIIEVGATGYFSRYPY